MRQTETNAATVINNDDLYYLTRTMYAEARGEGERGMLHVGSVILNRVKDGRFRNTIRGVCLQPSQFTVWSRGNPAQNFIHRTIINDPVYAIAERAARQLLQTGPINSFLYFEASRNRGNGTLIGGHRFR